MKNDVRKYQNLIFSIIAFLSLILLLLIFTFYTSGLLERNTVLMNETSRISNAAQAVIKDLFDLENSYGEDIRSPHMKTVLSRLRVNSILITERLPLIRDGGNVDVNGKDINLPAVSSAVALENLAIAEKQWQLLNPKILAYLENADNVMVDSANDLTQAATQAKTSSLKINDALDKLAEETANQTAVQANTIRLVQIVGVVVIFAYFLIFIFFFVRRLRESDAQTLAAQRETQEIMQTVNTGLFLLDKDLKLGNQYSSALEGILGTNKLAGESLSSILRNRISDKDLSTAEEFVGQLYNPRVKEKLVNSLNPLHKVMLQNEQGIGESRYLDFTFSRVYEDKEIARILVNVNDVSEAVRLEQRLEKERTQNDRQIEMLTTILNVSPSIMNDFIKSTYRRIDSINNTLKNPGGSQFELEGKIKSIYREIHSLKGEASALKLHSFTKIASDIEDRLYILQNQGKLSGNDFLPLAVQLDELLNLSDAIKDLGNRINQSVQSGSSGLGVVTEAVMATDDKAVALTATDDAGEGDIVWLEEEDSIDAGLSAYLLQFGQDIAERQNKQVQIDVSKMADVRVPQALSVVVKEVCIQLLRNAIVHGIADSQTRIQNGKDPVGSVHISFEAYAGSNQDRFMVIIEDDGQGINYEAIRNRLINSGQYPIEAIAKFTQSQLLNTLFSSGFSTKAVVDEDGGRGVGLDIVKDRVKKYGGKINVQSEKGKFSRFIVNLPMSS